MSKITRKKINPTRVISVKLPLSLYEDLQAFRQELQAFDNTMILDVNDLVASALKRDLRVAREELENLKQVTMKSPPTQQSTLTPAPTLSVADAPVKTQRNPNGLQGEYPMEQTTSEEPERPIRIKDLMR
ncbi:MAG TPA: hypothetical protein PKC42_03315 [Candidatus Nanoperiomorbaceae bacterium]|jgi:hypothetical protein|nr:hypothetical protein [Candidatus Nanoperiomorbaceae bacterium]